MASEETLLRDKRTSTPHGARGGARVLLVVCCAAALLAGAAVSVSAVSAGSASASTELASKTKTLKPTPQPTISPPPNHKTADGAHTRGDLKRRPPNYWSTRATTPWPRAGPADRATARPRRRHGQDGAPRFRGSRDGPLAATPRPGPGSAVSRIARRPARGDATARTCIVRAGEVWLETSYVEGAKRKSLERFGYAFDVSDDFLVVGAPNFVTLEWREGYQDSVMIPTTSSRRRQAKS